MAIDRQRKAAGGDRQLPEKNGSLPVVEVGSTCRGALSLGGASCVGVWSAIQPVQQGTYVEGSLLSPPPGHAPAAGVGFVWHPSTRSEQLNS